MPLGFWATTRPFVFADGDGEGPEAAGAGVCDCDDIVVLECCGVGCGDGLELRPLAKGAGDSSENKLIKSAENSKSNFGASNGKLADWSLHFGRLQVTQCGFKRGWCARPERADRGQIRSRDLQLMLQCLATVSVTRIHHHRPLFPGNTPIRAITTDIRCCYALRWFTHDKKCKETKMENAIRLFVATHEHTVLQLPLHPLCCQRPRSPANLHAGRSKGYIAELECWRLEGLELGLGVFLDWRVVPFVWPVW